MAAKNSSIDKMILRIAVSINKLLYNYIHFSVFSERANFSPVRVRRENFYQLPMALVDVYSEIEVTTVLQLVRVVWTHCGIPN